VVDSVVFGTYMEGLVQMRAVNCVRVSVCVVPREALKMIWRKAVKRHGRLFHSDHPELVMSEEAAVTVARSAASGAVRPGVGAAARVGDRHLYGRSGKPVKKTALPSSSGIKSVVSATLTVLIPYTYQSVGVSTHLYMVCSA
jgi:hypothetical protein